jgi:hypothetical protein
VSIPLNKALSYNCYNNGIEACKAGREKGDSFRSRITGLSNCLSSVRGSCSAAGGLKRRERAVKTHRNQNAFLKVVVVAENGLFARIVEQCPDAHFFEF